MTNEEKLVLEEVINNARDEIQICLEYAMNCAKAFLDKIEKAQPNMSWKVRKIEKLKRELEIIVKTIDKFDAQIMKIEWIKGKLEK